MQITLKMATCGRNMLVKITHFLHLINSRNTQHINLKLNNLLSILPTWSLTVNHIDKLEETTMHTKSDHSKFIQNRL